ncbi:MAG: ATP-binding protein [Deltaproteobacteria bacterium]|nr:ATP-binding protein [Deltaproteobacteria bacterium]
MSQSFDLMLSSINQYIKKIEKAEETLRFNERFLASIFDSIQDGLSILDTNHEVIRVNPFMERQFSQAMPLVGKKCYEVFHGSDQPCEVCAARLTMETGQAGFKEETRVGERGEILNWFEIRIFPLMDAATGKVSGVIEHIRDMTQQKQAEEALHRSEEQLRQSQKMEAVGCLAGGVAHDFNNILTAIIGYVELLRLKFKYDDPHQKDLQEIQSAAERAASLTSQLLAFSRKQIFSPKVLNLNNLVMNLDKMLRRLLSEDIELVTIPGAKLGMVMADPGQIEQVVINLVVNARDAMPQGGVITIETGNVILDATYARSHLEVNPGPYVMVAVGDTGRGMDEVSQGRIFEPFFTTKEMGKGTGLGLSTVHGIVKQSGGHISVYSEPGHGTNFKVYLPRLSQSEEKEAAAPSKCPLHRGSETILLVEDEDMVRHVARRLLEMNGYTVLEASSGHDALSVSQQTPGRIHLMLTDVVMPGISGGETAELLKAQRPEIKVLFMSGHTENSIVHHGVLNPGVAFLQKPFKHELLVSKVREVLDGPSTLH